MKKENMKDTSFQFKISREILEKLKILSKKEDRTIASIVRIAINEYLDNNNI